MQWAHMENGLVIPDFAKDQREGGLRCPQGPLPLYMKNLIVKKWIVKDIGKQ